MFMACGEMQKQQNSLIWKPISVDHAPCGISPTVFCVKKKTVDHEQIKFYKSLTSLTHNQLLLSHIRRTSDSNQAKDVKQGLFGEKFSAFAARHFCNKRPMRSVTSLVADCHRAGPYPYANDISSVQPKPKGQQNNGSRRIKLKHHKTVSFMSAIGSLVPLKVQARPPGDADAALPWRKTSVSTVLDCREALRIAKPCTESIHSSHACWNVDVKIQQRLTNR